MAATAITNNQSALELRIKELEAKLAQSSAPRKLSCRVGKAGGVSLYGMGRFPVTLYKQQWLRLFDAVPEIKAFIAANEKDLTTKQ